ncbi:hypothetical protein [Burkholderia phage vB_BpP_HN04]|nr:hypothetical protein [Burkholderia phage vB_BpP_HN01]
MSKRNSGQTTRLVLFYVQQCLEHPSDEIAVSDHPAENAVHATIHQNLMVANKVSAILTALNVQHYVNSNKVCVLPINKDQ